MMAREDAPVSIATQAIAQILRAMYPPSSLVHVGWGNGLGDLTRWTAWQLPQTFVIEAEESKAAACQAQALTLAQSKGQPNSTWQTIHATLSGQTHEQPYHLASNPSESGLVPPESLQSAWPHLRTVTAQTVMTRSLDQVWQEISPQLPQAESARHTWLIIDCLPAGDILSGGVNALHSAHVVCARSLLANRASLNDQMRSAGWVEAAWAESQHPAFGHAWFTRDTALELDKASKRYAQLSAEHALLFKSQKAETTAKTQALAERDALAQTKATLQTELDNATKRQAQLATERDEQQKAAEQAFVQIETLTQPRDLYLSQRDEFNHIRVEQQTQLEVLSQEIQSVKAEKSILDDTHQDLIARIRLMEDEISRTEGQIELIKDLMLSDGRNT